MPILTRKVTKEQRKWLKDYESSTGFEPMHQEDLDRSPKMFAKIAKLNLRWFEEHAREIHRSLERSLEADLQEIEDAAS